MRLALDLGYWRPQTDPAEQVALAREAERLGFAAVTVAEAYGSDAVSVLGQLAASTDTVGLRSSVLQIPGRTPALTAMTAATLDRLSHGRFELGLGVSGPQVSEGWHGVAFGDPLGRTREYVDLVRRALTREPLTGDGPHFPLPITGSGAPALRLAVRTERPRLPIHLAALGPRNLELTGEVADGAIVLFCPPEEVPDVRRRLALGAARSGRDAALLEVTVSVSLAVGPDLERCADAVRPGAALYVGGMGSRDRNFYADRARALGFATETAAVQDLYLAGQHRDAAAAVPTALIERTALIGDRAHLATRIADHAAAGVDTLAVSPTAPSHEGRIEELRTVASALADLAVPPSTRAAAPDGDR